MFYQDGRFFIRDLNSSNGNQTMIYNRYKYCEFSKLLMPNNGKEKARYYFNLGTYLVIDGKPAMCINKETNDSMIEVFSGDILQFGQGHISFFIRIIILHYLLTRLICMINF